jgi:hypothetical protein
VEEQPKSVLALPLTFGGVASFGHAPLRRLRVFQAVTALLAAGLIGWFVETAWVPVIRQTIQALPSTGSIEDGVLRWPGANPVRVASSSFLWISVDPTGSLERGEGADLQVDFSRTELRFRSLFGYAALPYPRGYFIALSHAEVEAWWEAWHPLVTSALVAVVFLGLFLIWGTLALVYTWPVRLIAFYADRKLSWFGSWRLASAALLPGAVFFLLALLAYSMQRLNLVQLLFATVLHVMIGWVYVLFSPFALPRQTGGVNKTASATNPFGNSTTTPAENPFAKPSGKAER